MKRPSVVVAMFLISCAGSPIGGKYGLGNNGAGYAEEARVRQERRDRVAAARAQFSQYCMTPVERTPAQYQWCIMRQYELGREEDRVERQEDREDQQEHEFQVRREKRLNELTPPPAPVINCTTSTAYGIATTHCN